MKNARTMTWRPVPAAAAGLGFAALCALYLASCTSTLGYAAVVNGSVVSQTSINQQLDDIAANQSFVRLVDQPGQGGPVAGTTTGTFNMAFVANILNRQVELELIHQTLVADKALPGPDKLAAAKTEVSQPYQGTFSAFPARYQTLLIEQQAEADAFISAVGDRMSSDALNQYYQAHLGDFATESCVRHILIADKDASGSLDYSASLADAQKIKGLLDAGGDFAALAKTYSQDNQGTNGGSANSGGSIAGSGADGCLTPSDLQQLVSEFSTAVVALPLNQVSNPVRSLFGYHLIEVTRRVVEPLDASVTKAIQQQMAGVELTDLVAHAKVKVNPRFGSFDRRADPNGAIPGVIPPAVPSLGTTTSTTVPAPSAGTGSSSGG